MTSFTSPGILIGKAGAGAGTMAATAPAAAVGAPAVTSGVATQYWVELVAYPPGSTASLWLLVSGAWKRYDNPPAYMSELVQQGFASGATVRVWYDGEVIVGLVVSK